MQTKFWQNNFPANVLLTPQFELGKYLKQLDKTYNHPKYKVDFLLVFNDETHQQHKIIIEYDGFEEHFTHTDRVNEYNYSEYYTEQDVYRQKVLEGYGYKFLRINRFNIGKNPIETLDARLTAVIRNRVSSTGTLSNIHNTIEGLQNGEMKECPKCKEVRPFEDFKDASLISGYGRFCRHCKGLIKSKKKTSKKSKSASIKTGKTCPKCGSQMQLRSGRYGKFYGCTKYPYCRGTQRYR